MLEGWELANSAKGYLIVYTPKFAPWNPSLNNNYDDNNNNNNKNPSYSVRCWQFQPWVSLSRQPTLHGELKASERTVESERESENESESESERDEQRWVQLRNNNFA